MKASGCKLFMAGFLLLLCGSLAPCFGVTSLDTEYYLLELVNPYNSPIMEISAYYPFHNEYPHVTGSGLAYTFHSDIRAYYAKVGSSAGIPQTLYAYFTDGVTPGTRELVGVANVRWPANSETIVRAPKGKYISRIEVVGYGGDYTAVVHSRLASFYTLSASSDFDSDNLSDLAEFEAQTDYFDPDTDGDGVRDGFDNNPLVQKQWYALNLIPTLGGTETKPFAINNMGAITGYSKKEDGQLRAFIYSGSYMRDLGTVGGSLSWGYDISDNNDVVGYSYAANSYTEHAFLYKSDEETMTDLSGAVAAYGQESGGVAINNNRQIALSATKKVFAGWDYRLGIKKYKYYSYALLYDNGMVTLLNPSGNTAISPRCINERGVVGTSSSSGMYIYDPAVPSMTLYANLLWADEINDNDEVLGWYYGSVLIYDMNDHTLVNIGSLGSGIYATKMNDYAQVVGHCQASAYNYQDHAFLYDPTLGIMDLNEQLDPDSQTMLDGAFLNMAFDINDPGQIVGTISDGRAFRLDPIQWTK